MKTGRILSTFYAIFVLTLVSSVLNVPLFAEPDSKFDRMGETVIRNIQNAQDLRIASIASQLELDKADAESLKRLVYEQSRASLAYRFPVGMVKAVMAILDATAVPADAEETDAQRLVRIQKSQLAAQFLMKLYFENDKSKRAFTPSVERAVLNALIRTDDGATAEIILKGYLASNGSRINPEGSLQKRAFDRVRKDYNDPALLELIVKVLRITESKRAKLLRDQAAKAAAKKAEAEQPYRHHQVVLPVGGGARKPQF